MRTLDTLTKRRRENKRILLRKEDRRDNALSEQKGVEAYLQLATPHPWTATFEFALPVPSLKGHFHEQAQKIQDELTDLYARELDLDNEEYVGVGNDRKGVTGRISELEDPLEFRVNQENLLHSLSKKDLLSAVANFPFQHAHTGLPSVDELRKSSTSKTDLILLLTETMGESYQDVRDITGVDDWL